MSGEVRSRSPAPPGAVIVDVAAYCISSDPGATLVTYSLGSCIAVTAYHARLHVAGLIHVMLPMSSVSPQKAVSSPAMFADSGIPLLFHDLDERGCRREELVVKLIGGGGLYDEGDTFAIGQRNIAMARKVLWKNGILLAGEDTGGAKSRTVRLHVGTGVVVVRTPAEENVL